MLRPRLDIPFRKEKGLLVTAIGVAAGAVVAQPVTAADVSNKPEAPDPASLNAPCYGQGNCYAYAETTGFIADGAAARFDRRNYVTQDWEKGGFTAQVLWVAVENSGPGNEWCEIGWTKGWVDPFPPHEPQASASQYYAFSVNGQYTERFPASPALGGDGTSHHYQVLREYDGKYNFYIDNVDVGDCFADPFTLAAAVGLEYTNPINAAPRNDPRQLQWRRATDLAWFDWGSLGTSVVDYEISPDGRAQWAWDTFPTHGKDWIGN